MKFVGDFHIHSKYARATSKEMNLENLSHWASIKGVKVVGTGDFTHPLWFKELKEKLQESQEGLYKLKKQYQVSEKSQETFFILTTEISCIYSKKGKVRKVHLIIFAPNLETAEKINAYLGLRGNLASDGRPTLGLDAKEATKIILNISANCLIVPAHAWTPWFSVFGSRSGFDSLEECFEEYTKYIYAIETGLSSDPAMNWRVSSLDRVTLISNSDCHSPSKIGREANVFDTELSYNGIVQAIKEKDPKKFLFTIEFFPEEGKYHFDGHRLCGVRLTPLEARSYNDICPKCTRPLTIGVMHRVEELADRPEGFKPENAIPFKSLVPLAEIIGEALGVASLSRKVAEEYEKLIREVGNELFILLEAPKEELEAKTLPAIVEGIMRVREGKVLLEPGYDGVYGKVRIFAKEDKTLVESSTRQKSLF